GCLGEERFFLLKQLGKFGRGDKSNGREELIPGRNFTWNERFFREGRDAAFSGFGPNNHRPGDRIGP
ncbi:MAG: hypothetical protein ACRCZF_13110, partial [Gemmataceae bacterium]